MGFNAIRYYAIGICVAFVLSLAGYLRDRSPDVKRHGCDVMQGATIFVYDMTQSDVL